MNPFSKTDSLTGLPNGPAMLAQLEQAETDAQVAARPFSVILLDVDGFKDYNNKRGYAAGDCVLKQMAHVLRENRRAGDSAGRMGDDQFVIILPQTDAAAALAEAERLRGCIAAAAWPAQPMTVSGGVESWDGDRTGVTARTAVLLGEVVRALHWAKEQRR